MKEFILSILICTVLFLTGCGTTKAQKGLTGGAAIGALAGGLITDSWSGAAVGGALGGGMGYAYGSEEDKVIMQRQQAAERQAMARAEITSNPQTAYRPPANNKLVGTTWRVISLSGGDPEPDYKSLVITFTSNTSLVSVAVLEDGTTNTSAESYHLLGDAMIISGTNPSTGQSYVINAKYSIQNEQMVFVTPAMQIVLEKVISA